MHLLFAAASKVVVGIGVGNIGNGLPYHLRVLLARGAAQRILIGLSCFAQLALPRINVTQQEMEGVSRGRQLDCFMQELNRLLWSPLVRSDHRSGVIGHGAFWIQPHHGRYLVLSFLPTALACQLGEPIQVHDGQVGSQLPGDLRCLDVT